MRAPGEIVDEILAKRCITDRSEFFAEKPLATYDPFLLPGMDDGVDTAYRHIAEGKRICVYGDYDADGLLSVTLLTEFFESLPGVQRERISWYIPSRFGEGYGLNEAAIKQLRADGAELIITVDCGIVSAREVDAAMSAGMAVVITDHHEPDPAAVPACPVIDPKIPGSAYPFAGLCGCGVAFKLAQAMRTRYYPDDEDVRAVLYSTLDLVAVATVADMMPLVDENRTLVKYGLRALNSGERWQLAELAEGIGLRLGEITAYNIAFGIAPHLNAAGRMGDAALAVGLFKAEDRNAARTIATELTSMNKERRGEQDESFSACVDIIEKKYQNSHFLLVKPPRAHEGVAGIVAGNIKERYHRPVAVLVDTDEGGKRVLKGSARSVAGLDITALIRAHEDLLVKYGGHAMAAGFTLRPGDEETLREALEADVRALAADNPDLFSPPCSYDSEIQPEDASMELARMLEDFEPTGEGNPRPVLRIKAQLPENIRRIGAEGRHVRFTAGRLECVFFARGPQRVELTHGDGPFDLYGSLDINRWNGRESVRFIVRQAPCSKCSGR
ncbi:MAG: single-stranded-DNA-specific exonuclease RecJ [Clostridiales Family XIII bacterium]|jgi:single-stranded-DNA-specific exonuclease|nr:single-stranded-DNA-specific exonuclease RecJ [Clostridiales Family XIII bacterium]